MPSYDYLCKKGHKFEDFQPMDAPAPACPTCKAESKKVPSAPFVVGGDTPKFYPGRR